jgi:hypothetical protein
VVSVALHGCGGRRVLFDFLLNGGSMKRVALMGTMALGFALGVCVPAFAQDAPKEEAKPAESKPAEEKPAAKPATRPAAKPATHAENKPQEAKPEDRKPDEAKPATHAENKPAQKTEAKPAPARNENAHNDAARRENTKATTKNVSQKNDPHRIPDDKYRANFGREHTFHVGHPVAAGGRYRFAYGGYNFYYTEAWPAGWGYDDDVYVIDVNGVYYLMDVAHPGVQLALVIDL